MANGGNTWVFTSEAADKVGEGGRHGAIPGERERVSGRRENPAGKSSGVGGREGSTRSREWRKTLGGIAREWEGESSCRGASTPPEWKSLPRGNKPLQ